VHREAEGDRGASPTDRDSEFRISVVAHIESQRADRRIYLLATFEMTRQGALNAVVAARREWATNAKRYGKVGGGSVALEIDGHVFARVVLDRLNISDFDVWDSLIPSDDVT
jgi:hypothetical protein